MTKLNYNEVARYCAKPDLARPLVLVFGQDTGLISERVETILASVLKGNDDPFARVTLEGADLASDPDRLADEAFTISLFGGKRAIRVRMSGNKSIVPAIEKLLVTPPTDAIVVIEAGDLKPAHALRKKIEQAKTAVAIACYPDTMRDLSNLIDGMLRDNQLTISKDAKNMLLHLLGADRRASRGELEKLVLYAKGQGQITLDDVAAIIGDASALRIDGLMDATLIGKSHEAMALFHRLIEAGTAPSTLLTVLHRQVQLLHRLRGEMDAGASATVAIDAIRPPIFHKRKAVLIDILAKWPDTQIEKALFRLQELSAECRLKADLATPLLGTFILSISRFAAKR